MQSEIDIPLKTPIEYASHGQTVEAKFVKLVAPTKKQITDNVYLKQAFFCAIDSGDSGNEPDHQDKKSSAIPTGPEIMMMLYMSPKVDMNKVMLTGMSLLVSGVALVDGSEKVTSPILDSMSLDDIESLVGAYMVNFTLASSWDALKST